MVACVSLGGGRKEQSVSLFQSARVSRADFQGSSLRTTFNSGRLSISLDVHNSGTIPSGKATTHLLIPLGWSYQSMPHQKGFLTTLSTIYGQEIRWELENIDVQERLSLELQFASLPYGTQGENVYAAINSEYAPTSFVASKVNAVKEGRECRMMIRSICSADYWVMWKLST